MNRVLRAAAAAGAALAVTVAMAQANMSTASLDRIGREIVLLRCARPIEVKTVTVRAEQPGRPDDEMESVSCAGLRLAVLRSNASTPARERPMSLVIEDAHPQLPAPVAVGASPESVRATLGAPTVMLGDNLVYALAARNTLTFEVQAGRVRAVTWTWDVD